MESVICARTVNPGKAVMANAVLEEDLRVREIDPVHPSQQAYNNIAEAITLQVDVLKDATGKSKGGSALAPSTSKKVTPSSWRIARRDSFHTSPMGAGRGFKQGRG
jgi:hypothetical protein